jgi:hypothetical protein
VVLTIFEPEFRPGTDRWLAEVSFGEACALRSLPKPVVEQSFLPR